MPNTDGLAWPGGVVQLSSGALLVPAWKFTTGHELFVRLHSGPVAGEERANHWSAIDTTPGSSGSDPKFLTSAGGNAFYAAFDSSELWVTDGVRARVLATVVGTISGVVGVAVRGSELVVTAHGRLLYVIPPAAAAAEGAALALVFDIFGSGSGLDGYTDVSAPRFGSPAGPHPDYVYFFATRSGVRSLFVMESRDSAPVALFNNVAASGAPTQVSAGIAFITAVGAVKLFDDVRRSIVDVAPALAYAGAANLAWVWAGVCFTAITTPSAPAELVCAGVERGDFSAFARSAAAGVTLPNPGYLLGVGHNVVTACDIASAGGPHLCAFDPVTGTLAWSTRSDSAGLSVNYNAQALIGDTLYFAAEAAGAGKATLWALPMA